MNSMQLKDKLRAISRKRNIDFNTILRLYMYDRFIERLSLSQYKDNFILKGGFYLSMLFGVESRNTMDIDVAFKNDNFNKRNLEKIIKHIISIDINDHAQLDYLGISSIRNEDEYGGYRIDLMVKIENIREQFHLDIATGDPITPKEISYKYKTILEDRVINVWAYNIESVLAEKLETVLNRVESNGRMRDFYDIYLIYSKEWESINQDDFRNAVKETFKKRAFNKDVIETFKVIRESEILKSRWYIYANKYDYARNIDFIEIIDCIEHIVKVIGIVSIKAL